MAAAESEPRRIGDRYVLYGTIAAGGMATVHWGRLQGPVGFSRTVAVKRLHAQFASDPEFVAMFLDEARLAARIQHPNVVSSLDVVATDEELFLVMEYVHGESLSRLLKSGPKSARIALPPRLAASIATGALFGLHAAHDAVDEQGNPLQIVHRDISPQNIMVGVDGISRVLDFGVAKAAGNSSHTRDGNLKGKLAYMSPEQLRATGVDRRTDVYAASIVLWEMLTGRRLVEGEDDVTLLARALEGNIPWPSTIIQGIPPALEAVVMKGLSRDLGQRYQSARDMALAIEHAVPLASQREVGEWVQSVASKRLGERAQRIKAVEAGGEARSLDAAGLAAAMRARTQQDVRSAVLAEADYARASMPSVPSAAGSGSLVSNTAVSPPDLRSSSHLTSMSSAATLAPPAENPINKVFLVIGALATAVILMGGGALAMSQLSQSATSVPSPPLPVPTAAPSATPTAPVSVVAPTATAPTGDPSALVPPGTTGTAAATTTTGRTPPASTIAPPTGTKVKPAHTKEPATTAAPPATTVVTPPPTTAPPATTTKSTNTRILDEGRK
jgi:eukaryotic-like serine/threonine-protein kinase